MTISRFLMAGAVAFGLTLSVQPGFAGEKVKTVVVAENANAAASEFTVTKLTVIVPRTLEVSEAMDIMPDADIVWRGDPPGDRYKQVRAIVTDAMTAGIKGLNGPRRVEVTVQISRFHCLTERARAYVGGWYAIKFYMQVKDADTGAQIGELTRFDVTKTALGRGAAMIQELQGTTQKHVIGEHLGRMIRVALEEVAG
jgi:hypothetical protein